MLVKKFGTGFVACDGRCEKAWGISNRPNEQLSEDEDDYVYLADRELGDAPEDPGTYEGDHGKPFAHSFESHSEGMNKWCARECERSITEYFSTSTGAVPVLPDFSNRVFNMPKEPTP